LNLCKPNTCLNWTNSSVPKGFGLDRFYCSGVIYFHASLKMVCLILISKWFYTFCFISSKFSTSVSKTSDSDCSCCTLSCLCSNCWLKSPWRSLNTPISSSQPLASYGIYMNHVMCYSIMHTIVIWNETKGKSILKLGLSRPSLNLHENVLNTLQEKV
jgi:hypothetical protein